jgi:ABC-type uncharacterized transport system permease subunit
MPSCWLFSGLIGRRPRFGFAPALSVTVWLIAAVYAVESHFYPQLRIRWSLCLLGPVGVLLAQFFRAPLLPPRTSVWLPVHWALGIASYGLFGCCGGPCLVHGSCRGAHAQGGRSRPAACRC